MRYNMSGLETLTIVMNRSGASRLEGKIHLPIRSQSDPSDPNFLSLPSAVVATIRKNGSTLFTSIAGSDGFSVPVSFVIGDTLTVQLSSAAAPDQVLNAVNAVVTIG